MSLTAKCEDKIDTTCTAEQKADDPWACGNCYADNLEEMMKGSCNSVNPPGANPPYLMKARIDKNCGVNCYLQLKKSCAGAKRSSVGNCFVCAGTHQKQMDAAGCTSGMFDWYCNNPEESPAEACDRLLRNYIGDKLTYAGCVAELPYIIDNAYPICHGLPVANWCKNNSTDMCPDEDFCTVGAFKGTCQSCKIGSTCPGNTKCGSRDGGTKPTGCNISRCPSFDCWGTGGCKPATPCYRQDGDWEDCGKYGTLQGCQRLCR